MGWGSAVDIMPMGGPVLQCATNSQCCDQRLHLHPNGPRAYHVSTSIHHRSDRSPDLDASRVPPLGHPHWHAFELLCQVLADPLVVLGPILRVNRGERTQHSVSDDHRS